MANLKVNTDRVVAAATSIKTMNIQLRDGFSNVVNAMARLDNTWDGSAAASAINKFNEIKANFPEARYAVVDNYVNFLLQQIGEGYTLSEEVNTTLADAFK